MADSEVLVSYHDHSNKALQKQTNYSRLAINRKINYTCQMKSDYILCRVILLHLLTAKFFNSHQSPKIHITVPKNAIWINFHPFSLLLLDYSA